ncbi:JAB domain-containing protein [Tenacibaculum agarivorans]|uniref:JAB domain-containing protein n=1 Tax=Tenacibaculum agarivorans TaxID=1908389 RepID=UPI000A4EA7E7|nr:JAB domain-containing protein [Tenacibaculum agarivorans]
MEVTEIKVSYSNNNNSRIKVKGSNQAYKVIMEKWNKDLLELQEEAKIILLNRANELLGIYELSKGGTSSTIIDIKLVLSVALKTNAHGLILFHNHPSGNLIPSSSDRSITEKLKKACELIDIKLLDHLIITKAGYYSFSDELIL